MVEQKFKKNSGNICNIKQVSYETIQSMPISLSIVTLYAMLITKKYIKLKTFSWGEKSTSVFEGWGIIGYFEKVSSIFKNNEITLDDSIIEEINASGYDMSHVSNLLNKLQIIPTSVIDHTIKHKTNHYIKGMKTTNGVGTVKTSGNKLSIKEVPSSTILLKEKAVDYCLKELYSILPDGVIKAMLDREAIKLVLGNQTEILLPGIIEDYKAVIGQKSVNARTLQK